MWPDTRLLDLPGIELPIVQAPMAAATGVEMAVAVAKAGGLGSLPCACSPPKKSAPACPRSGAHHCPSLNIFCHAAPDSDVASEQDWSTSLTWYDELGAKQTSLDSARAIRSRNLQPVRSL